MRRTGLVALALLALGGCGGSSSQYAGLGQYEARIEVLHGMTRELKDRTSPVHGHPVRLLRLDRGENRGGGEAWVGTFADRTTGDRICIRVTGHPHPFGLDVDLEVDDCAAGPAGV